MSACAVTFSSRLARPRTISRAGRPPSAPAQTARPFSTSACDSVSSAALVSSLSLPISALASASVRPRIWALRKFEASCSCEAVVPAGSSTMRFSTSPFCDTSTASALVGSSWMNSMCFSGTSFLAASTRPAPRDMPDSIWLASVSMCSSEAPLPDALTCASIDAALLVGQVADLHEGVDEEAQAALRRQPAGRDMRRIDEAEMLEVAHHVADRGRRQRQRQHARQVARADRLAVLADRNRRCAGRCRASAHPASAGLDPCRSWARFPNDIRGR